MDEIALLGNSLKNEEAAILLVGNVFPRGDIRAEYPSTVKPLPRFSPVCPPWSPPEAWISFLSPKFLRYRVTPVQR